ncbi:hypothetical protein [Desulfovibrio inopinatus]|uniref:hypothetical protein n=1 Tax=Desulfovibrio inopinatus TaxID=102109 RepID=UPI0003F613D6|nr:hypothetical protein [Desulfovibrio inopinatus]
MGTDFHNDDKALLEKVDETLEQRKKNGLEGLSGGLEAVIIAVEPERLLPAAQEFINYTGHDVVDAFEDNAQKTIVLKREGSADILVYTRSGHENPFAASNRGAKTGPYPNTRLETFVFKCPDIETYVAKQTGCGRSFLTQDIQQTDTYSFIQTPPSAYTCNSVGFIQWKNNEGEYRSQHATPFDPGLTKPEASYCSNILELDHAATRVRAEERDAAIIEFMEWTNYHFEFAVYVESLNSITNVSRLSLDDFALVFTSGIRPFVSLEESGPTERFIYNYGPRTHHLAFNTENIEDTVDALAEHGMGYISELIGSREEGLKQIFTKPSPHTLIVNEYIHRYDDFDGFFTKSNVTALTKATEKQ